MEFGSLLKRKRIERNLTLEELANKTGVSVAYLSRLENGIRVNPSMKIMQKIDKALKSSNSKSEIVIPINIINLNVILEKRVLNKEERLHLQKCIDEILSQK
ncbi:MAG: helix-turn-helix transcriptional regulator [Clostridium sp.]|uniref:helix-turn-helix domain-containing protein n=1 Tax=Clostridium sp. TaxID=1506 RepID=UPI00290EC190|nr:helix-turn-helix transcriptional regulator [Clostridium sp.]MDU7150095.1 helix-turn-helix transcriptional regulator [Clostridium sp.]